MSELITGGAGVIGSNVVRYGVRVAKEVVIDVVIEIGRSLPTFGQLVGEFLLAENKRQMWVLERFAHGFGVLSDTDEYLYKTTDCYAPEDQRSIIRNDRAIAIGFRIDREPVLCPMAGQGQPLSDAKYFA